MSIHKFQVSQDPSKGRCLIAVADLTQAEVILEEVPLNSDVACFGCYSTLDEEDPAACSKCGLPMCQQVEDCENRPNHQAECQVFQKTGGKTTSLRLLDNLSLLHDVVLVLRCLHLKQQCEESWAWLNQMQSHQELRSQRADIPDRVALIARVVINDLDCSDASLDLIEHVSGILDINCFEVPNFGGTVQALYHLSSMMEHNCVPNIHRSFTELSLIVRASTAIPTGSHLTISYADSLATTSDRQGFLEDTKFFRCDCSRCSDSTELGTHLSTLKCPKCPVGNLLADEPLLADSNWSCDACMSQVSPHFARNVLAQVSETLAWLESSNPDPTQCDKFLLIHSRVLHMNHAIMVDVSHTLLHLYGHCQGFLMSDLSERQLQHKEDLARGLMRIADAVLPGLSRIASTSLYQLFLVLRQRAYNWLTSDQRPHADVEAAFQVALSTLQRCMDMLQLEPKESPEGCQLLVAESDLANLEEFIGGLITQADS